MKYNKNEINDIRNNFIRDNNKLIEDINIIKKKQEELKKLYIKQINIFKPYDKVRIYDIERIKNTFYNTKYGIIYNNIIKYGIISKNPIEKIDNEGIIYYNIYIFRDEHNNFPEIIPDNFNIEIINNDSLLNKFQENIKKIYDK